MSIEFRLEGGGVGPPLALAEERAGQRVVLGYSGPMPARTIRVILLLFVTPFVLTPACSLQRALTADGPDWVRIGLDVSSVLLGLVIVLAASRGIPAFHRRIVFDRADGVTIVRDGWLLWFRRTEAVPAKAVEELSAKVSGSGEQTEIELSLGLPSITRKLRFAAVGVDRQGEGVDLVARIGRVFGLDSARIVRSDPRVVEAVLSAYRPGTVALTPTTTPPDYGGDASVIEAPATEVPRFDPASVRSRGSPAVVEWRPTTLVRTRVGALDPRIAGTLGAFAGAFVGWQWSLSLGLGESDLRLLAIVFAAAMAAGALIATRVGPRLFPEREITIEPRAGRVTFRRGRRERVLPIADLREVVLRGLKAEGGGGDGEKRFIAYRCRCELHFTDGVVRVLETESVRDDPDAPYRPMLSFTVELAQALDRPWRFVDYTEQDLQEVLREELGV